MARERSKNQEENQSIEPRRQGGQVFRSEPWSSFSRLGMMGRFFDDMDRMFEGFPTAGRRGAWAAPETFSAQVDVFERDGKLVITADLPGLNKEDVKVDITEDAILIEGERKYEHEQREEGIYRSERSYGCFRRQIPLPQGARTDTATATFKNGVLEIAMEAPQLAKTRRRIQIQEDGRENAA
jgi:HSP20 family protein